MRLVLQRVSRATLEINSCVESRIGFGVVVTLSIGKGDTVKVAKDLASNVLKFKIFPELIDPDSTCTSSLVDNGFEILAILQQSLNATFAKNAPNQERAADVSHANTVFDAFVATLREEYQEEMVVASPPKEGNMQLEMVRIGDGIYQLEPSDIVCMESESTPVKKAVTKPNVVSAPAAGIQGMDGSVPMLDAVTKTIRQIPNLPPGRNSAECERVLRILNLPKFRAAFAEAEQHQIEEFAEALDAAAHTFTEPQQEQIKSLTGLQMVAGAMPDALDEPLDGEHEESCMDGAPEADKDDDDDLEKQLNELQQEIVDPWKGIVAAKRRRTMDVKQENGEEARDTSVKDAVSIAALSAKQWAANRAARAQARANQSGKGGGKGKVKGPSSKPGLVQAKREFVGGPSNRRQGLSMAPRGTPTVAPMCPAATNAADL